MPSVGVFPNDYLEEIATNKNSRIENRLLAALPRRTYKALVADLQRVELNFAEELYRPGETVRQVYFPNSGIISLLSSTQDNESLEVGIIGNNGLAGVNVFLGVPIAGHRALVQAEGSAMRMSTAALRRHARINEPLRRLLRRYTHALMMQIAQSAICLRFHTVEARAARWLLLTQDFVQADELPMTQQFLSPMLGVRRERVAQAAGLLQDSGMIRYSRGQITVLDRRKLEVTACECYRKVKVEYAFLR